MNKFQRRKQACRDEIKRRMDDIEMSINENFLDSHGVFISNLIPFMFRHRILSCAVLLLATLITEIVFISTIGEFNILAAVFFYLIVLVVLTLALAAILSVLLVYEGISKQLISILFHKAPYRNGTAIDAFFSSLFS